MSRIFNAPLRLAAICAIWLCIGSPVLADPGSVAADGEDKIVAVQEPAADQPAGDDFQSVLRRLEQAEAEINRQREQLDQLQPQLNPFSKPTSAFGNFAVDNLTFTSKDGNFKAHIGGVVQLDLVGFANTPPGIGSG